MEQLSETSLPLLGTEIAFKESGRLLRYMQGMERLVQVVQELSLARNMETIIQVVRSAARELNGADGATFVLRDGEKCFYVEESAITPLWKGQHFPISTCISGWVMLNAQPVVIEDIYQDSRIPHEAYRPTFVKSLVMAPIRQSNPIGAIGNYWATQRMPTPEEVRLIEALANTTAVAIENVQLYNKLEERVRARTAQLEAVNKELEAFSYSVSHNLRAPLRAIEGFSRAVVKLYGDCLDERGKGYMDRVCRSSQQMDRLIEDILNLSLLTRGAMNIEENVNLSEIVQEVASELQRQEPLRRVDFEIESGILVKGDSHLLKVALQNLIANAWKYTAKHSSARIRFGALRKNEDTLYYVQDNGVGFDMKYAPKLFTAFQRLHNREEFEGTGIGLATVARIIQRHGGKIRAESEVEKGATFYFTLPNEGLADPVITTAE